NQIDDDVRIGYRGQDIFRAGNIAFNYFDPSLEIINQLLRRIKLVKDPDGVSVLDQPATKVATNEAQTAEDADSLMRWRCDESSPFPQRADRLVSLTGPGLCLHRSPTAATEKHNWDDSSASAASVPRDFRFRARLHPL